MRAVARVVVAALAAKGAYLLLLRRRILTWGATSREVTAPMPGDDLLPQAQLVATRAITVKSPADAVWPWLAQLGQGRGGFYSYDWLENLAGCKVVSTSHVVEHWQHPAVGDDFRLHPEVALKVAVVEAPRALVVRGAPPEELQAERAEAGLPYDFSWAFVLVPCGGETTRLVVRERYRYLRPWAFPLVETLAVASFVMTERMLRSIRDRAETAQHSKARRATTTP